MTSIRPPYDPEVELALNAMAAAIPLTITPQMIDEIRLTPSEGIEALLAHGGITHSEEVIPAYGGGEIAVSIVKREGNQDPGPGILFLHGGGMIAGDRFAGLGMCLPWILEHNAVVVTAEYRLAPEFPDPYPVEDCYAALTWMASMSSELGIVKDSILVTGASAGGGLAAGVSLMARDRNGPDLVGQLLIYPMLDERNETTSSTQFEGIGLWNRESNETGWNALLGSRRGTDDVSHYASPAKAQSLASLPPTFIDVASAEVFRDECVNFAMKVWADGGVAELHVWPGGTHAFDMIAPQSNVAVAAREARDSWLRRLLG